MGGLAKERKFLANAINNISSEQEFLHYSSKLVAHSLDVFIWLMKADFCLEKYEPKDKVLLFILLSFIWGLGLFKSWNQATFSFTDCFRFFAGLNPDPILELLHFFFFLINKNNTWLKTASFQSPS